MPWIAVHSSINGRKLRKLKKQLKIRSWEAKGLLVDLWLWGLENADRNGYIMDADRKDIEEFDNDYDNERGYTPKEVVTALIETGWIDEIDGAFYIHDWDVWQEFWYKAKDRRIKDAERKRESRKLKTDLASPVSGYRPLMPPPNEWAQSGSGEENTEIQTEKEKKPKKQAEEFPTKFEEFWSVYPRQVDKGQCYKKYKARLNDGFSPEELLIAAKNYAIQCKQLKTETKFIKHGKTFLGDSTPFVEFLPKKKLDEGQEPNPDNSNPFAQFGGDDSEKGI